MTVTEAGKVTMRGGSPLTGTLPGMNTGNRVCPVSPSPPPKAAKKIIEKCYAHMNRLNLTLAVLFLPRRLAAFNDGKQIIVLIYSKYLLHRAEEPTTTGGNYDTQSQTTQRNYHQWAQSCRRTGHAQRHRLYR